MTTTPFDRPVVTPPDSSVLGYQAIPELIRQSGIDTVFSMIGETNVPWIAEGVRTGSFRYVRTRHEGTAVSAAAGFSRTTGSVGLATVTRGPGFANAVNALKAAAHDHVPLLLLVAESPATKVKISPFYQNLDQRSISAALGVGFHHVSRVDELEESYWRAMRSAQWNGLPQVVSVADGLLDESVTLSAAPPPVPSPSAPEADSVVAAVDVLAGAKHPVILAGQGAVHADCRAELEELADLVGARLATTLNVNRYFSGHPHNLGVCGHSSPTVVADLLAQTDVVLAVGASLNPYTTAKGEIFKQATVVQVEIDIDQPFHATRPELGLLGDARVAARALIDEWRQRGLGTRQVGGTTPTPREIATSILDVDLGHDPSRGLDLRQVFSSLDSKIPQDRIVISDSGRWSGTLPSIVDARDGRSWVIARGYGSIGLGLGNAIGAAAGADGRPVVLFCGDGGFMMAAQELDAVRLNNLDLTIVIINDEQYGAEIPYLESYGLSTDVARQNLPDIELLATAFGGSGIVLHSAEDVEALELSYRGLCIVDARIDPMINGRAAL
jgi:acetolactate synthase-1/2/3 large subunit